MQDHLTARRTWYSETFYTPLHYAMKLRVVAHGQGSGEGTHASVAVWLQKGMYDAHLLFPCPCDYEITAVSRKSNTFGARDLTKQIRLSTANIDTNGRNAICSLGPEEFIPFAEMSLYLSEDSLLFTVREKDMRLFPAPVPPATLQSKQARAVPVSPSGHAANPAPFKRPRSDTQEP